MLYVVHQEHLREQKAPFVPEVGSRIDAIFESMRTMASGSREFKAAVRELTANFDDFPDAKPHKKGGPRRPNQRQTGRFIDWTFTRPTTKKRSSLAGAFADGASGCVNVHTPPRHHSLHLMPAPFCCSLLIPLVSFVSIVALRVCLTVTPAAAGGSGAGGAGAGSGSSS